MTEIAAKAEGREPWVEPATLEDIEVLTTLLMTLFHEEEDFVPDRHKQMHGIQMILEQPSRGRIFVVRNEHTIIGMVNILFIISTVEGGLVILLEDFVVHPDHRGQHYGSLLLEHVIQFARDKDLRRITLLTDKISQPSQRFFQRYGFVHSKMIPMRLVLSTSDNSTGGAGEE